MGCGAPRQGVTGIMRTPPSLAVGGGVLWGGVGWVGVYWWFGVFGGGYCDLAGFVRRLQFINGVQGGILKSQEMAEAKARGG